MNSKPSRFRYSVRTLVFAMSLICGYYGAWEATKTYGVRSTEQLLRELEEANRPLSPAISPPHESSPMPFVVCRTEYGYFHAIHRYYIWFFGSSSDVLFELSE